MLVERYERVNLFDLVPLERDAILDEMDQVLDAVSQWFTTVRTRKKAAREQRTLVFVDESGFYLLPAVSSFMVL